MGALAVNGTALAQTITETIQVSYIGIKMYFNGVETTVKDTMGNETEPFVYRGTTYVPLAFVAENLGQSVLWVGESNSIYIGAVPEETPSTTVNYEELYSEKRATWLNYLGSYTMNGKEYDSEALGLPYYFLYDPSISSEDLRYDYVDLNQDNVPEMFLLSPSGEIYALFTIQDGAVKNLLIDGERWGYDLSVDKTIVEWGSSGAADQMTAISKLNAQNEMEYALYLNHTLEDPYDWNSPDYNYFIPVINGELDFAQRRVATAAEEQQYTDACANLYTFDCKEFTEGLG